MCWMKITNQYLLNTNTQYLNFSFLTFTNKILIFTLCPTDGRPFGNITTCESWCKNFNPSTEYIDSVSSGFITRSVLKKKKKHDIH